MTIKPKIFCLLLLIVLVSGYTIGISHISAMRESLPAENRRAEALMVSPELFAVVSGEFQGVLADFLLLKASIFIGGVYDSISEDWQTVWHLFNQSHYLDPLFFQTCYYTQALLAWRPNLHEKSVQLIKSSAKHRDWDWEPAFFAGFDYYYYLKNYKESARYLEKASALPDAPPIVATLGARIARKGGKTQDAVLLLHVMYDQAKDTFHREIIRKRIDAYNGIIILENAIIEFQNQFGTRPGALKELLGKKIIAALPENPFGNPYYYDSSTGYLSFDGRQRLQ